MNEHSWRELVGEERAVGFDQVAIGVASSDTMGELATAPKDLERYRKDGFEITSSAMVDRVTAVIDKIEESETMKFKDWVIPGGSLPSAALDLARTTCRRAERRVAALVNDDRNFNIEILRYLNRLSDLCWLLARKLEQPQD